MVQRTAEVDRSADGIVTHSAILVQPSIADDIEQAKLRLEYAAETRRFEIERFWQRSLYFWTILGAAFVGYAAIEGKARRAQLVIACFGTVAALAWTLQNRGAKYWQEAWEQKTNNYQRAALGINLFEHKEPVLKKGWFGAARYSVSRLAIILSDFTVLIWIGLTARSLIASLPSTAVPPCIETVLAMASDYVAVAIVATTAAFCALLLVKGRSERDGSA